MPVMQVDPEDYPEWLRDLHNSSPVESLSEDAKETKSFSTLDDALGEMSKQEIVAPGSRIPRENNNSSGSGSRESSERQHSNRKEEEEQQRRSKQGKAKGRAKGRPTPKQLALNAINGKPYCMQCGATSTPLWRTFGIEVLCNACGLRRMRATTPYKRKKKKVKKTSIAVPKGTSKGTSGIPRRRSYSRSFEHQEEEPSYADDLESCENAFVRRGKRKRKTSVWLQDQYDNQADPHNDSSEDKPGSSTKLESLTGDRDAADEESISAQEACEVLANMDQLNSGESLEDGEFDLILKLHEVYGPQQQQSLYSQCIKKKEAGTLILAITLRATLNLFHAKRIDQSDKLWLIDQISSGKDQYLRSLPLATNSYEVLQDLLCHFLSQNRKVTAEDAVVATPPEVEQQQQSLGYNKPAERTANPPKLLFSQILPNEIFPSEVIHKEQAETFRSPPPLLFIPKSMEHPKDSQRSFQLNTPTIEEPMPRRPFT